MASLSTKTVTVFSHSQCLTSYRRKEIHRKVKCVDEKQLQINESFCDPATKPPSTKNCRISPSKYVVFTGELSQV